MKFSLKNLLLNPRRTVSTMVGIILSSALICATFTLGSSFQASLVKRAISCTGYYHLKLEGLTAETVGILKNNRDFSEVMTVEECGTAVLPGCQNASKPYVSLDAMDEETFRALKFNLLEGHFPKNNQEILISIHMQTNGKVSLAPGQSITLEVGERQDRDGFRLNSQNPYQEEGERIAGATAMTYTIAGIIDQPDFAYEAYSDPCYTVITGSTGEEAKNRCIAFLTLKNPYSYQKSFCELFGVKNYSDISRSRIDSASPYRNYTVNRELLRWEVLAFSDSTVSALCAIVGVVIFIIMFSSIFCIRNSFAIATTEKIRMLGMLASVGATKRQIRGTVLCEAFLLGIAAIPLGIVSGIFADLILLKTVSALLGDFLFGASGLVLSVRMPFLLLSALLGFVTIYFSALSSARRAARVSPIAQLKNAQDIQMSEKSLRIPRWVSRFFSTGGVLAWKNLRRSKKKYRTTVISLAVSIFTFITMNAWIGNAFRNAGVYYKDYDYNLLIWGRGEEDLTDQTVSAILNMEDIEEAHTLYQMPHVVNLTDRTRFDYQPDGDIERDRHLIVLSLDDAAFRLYTKKIGANYSQVADKGILCDVYMTLADGKYTQHRLYHYKKGDTISGTCQDKPYSAEVGFVTDIPPYGKESNQYYGGYLIQNRAYAGAEDESSILVLTIQSDNPAALTDRIQKMNPAISVNNLDAQVKEERSMLIVISIFLYGFITVITLIGVTSIFNTITSNMELRRREFAMLKSVGMTKKEFNRMIRLETLFYSVKAFLYGIAMSLFGIFLMWRAFSMQLDAKMYLPILPTAISGVFVFLFVFAVMKYSIHKMNRQNIIETIRSENI